jgi:hypothetical protein
MEATMTPDEIDIVEKRLKARCETFQKQPSEFVGYYGSHDAELDRDAATIRSLSTRLREAEEALEAWKAAYPESDEDNSEHNLWGRYGSEFAHAMRLTRRARALSGLEKEK